MGQTATAGTTMDMTQAQPVAGLLRNRHAFSHPVRALALRETHISWVILTGDYAYKIKKPLNLGFLDFSTLAARRYFCEQELHLNRRFSPELYLSVEPVVMTAHGPAIGSRGEVIDYAVCMRQFDDDALLAAIAARGELDSALLRKLAKCMATTHAQLASEYPTAGPGTPAAFAAAMRQNFKQIRARTLPASLAASVDRIADWSARRFDELAPAMQQRLHDGRIKDCHGDLHLGNIVRIDGDIRFFDCIEFEPAFRIMDTIAELAFATMDLDARDLPEAAARLTNDYLEYSGDMAGLELLDFYRCYYAVVRAKVNLLRDPDAGAKPDTLAVAGRYLARAREDAQPRAQFVVLMHGVSGSGKSTVAGELAALTAAVRLRSDVVRKRLFGLAPEAVSTGIDGVESIYTRDVGEQTFAALRTQTDSALAAGFGVIVDATFLSHAARAPFIELAAQANTTWLIATCEADAAVLEQRLHQRAGQPDNVSEADAAVMHDQLAHVDSFDDVERAHLVRVDTSTADARECAQQIVEYLSAVAERVG